MTPFAPQVDRNGSPFLSDGLARWNGTATPFKKPDWLVIYDGGTTALPTLAIPGLISLLSKVGEVNPVKVSFRNILQANVVNGNATLTKHKTRIECRKLQCQGNEYFGTVLTRRSAGTVSYLMREYVGFDPVDPAFPDCEMDCLKRAQFIVDKINSDPYSVWTATLVTENNNPTTYSIDIEAKNAGEVFDQSVVGFTPSDILVSASRESYTARLLREQWGSDMFPTTIADNKVYTAVEIVYYEPINTESYSGSSVASPRGNFTLSETLGVVLFDETVTNSSNALTELKAILNYEKTASLYHSRLVSTASSPAITYVYTIAKVDAGDASAFTTASAAYSNGNTVSFIRAAYDSTTGTSYYTIRSKVNTSPTPSGSDKVEPGSYGPDDTPCLNCE